MARLLPCPGCERHVRISESLCPFCAEALPLAYQSAGPAALPTKRLGRAAKFAFGAAVAGALAVTGCGDDGGSTDSGTDSSMMVDSGGGDSSTGDSSVEDSSTGDSSAGDSSAGDAGDAAMDSGAMALYGGPPPADAGDDAAMDSGGTMALYGAPPEA